MKTVVEFKRSSTFIRNKMLGITKELDKHYAAMAKLHQELVSHEQDACEMEDEFQLMLEDYVELVGVDKLEVGFLDYSNKATVSFVNGVPKMEYNDE